jgi:NADPH-dependent 2,4-dienoyl-CoA reductase/sulfur reductase-like enzyme/rhodanese-related sulfurtransferase
MSKKLVVIGAVAAGTKAAAKARREHPDWDITVLEKGNDISYAGCGLPYFIGGVIPERRQLVVRTPEHFLREFGIKVLTGHEATSINVESKTVTARDLSTGEAKSFPYDTLIIATGATPVIPPVPGIELPGVHTVRSIADAEAITGALGGEAGKAAERAVVVGGGMIGLEVAENLKARGLHVSVVELTSQVLPGFDPEMAALVEAALRANGVEVYTGEKVTSFEVGPSGRVAKAVTSSREIPCDLAIWATGVKPNTALARNAGIELGPTGAIKVDDNMRTSVDSVFAVGDCAENKNLLTGKAAWYPMGSTANKMGRIAAMNLDGEVDEAPILPGVLGTSVLKVFSVSAAKTGLSEKAARDEGFDVVTVLVPASDRAHYYPGYKTIVAKLVVDAPTHRVLGAQVVGEGVVDKPIDIIATAISLGGTVDDLSVLDLAYAPPFSMAMSSTIVAANVALNKLEGKVSGISPEDLRERLGDPDLQIVDVRSDAEVAAGKIPGSIHIPLSRLAERLEELDRSKTQVLVCRVGLRAYLAANTLRAAGFEKAAILDGGMLMWRDEVQ